MVSNNSINLLEDKKDKSSLISTSGNKVWRYLAVSLLFFVTVSSIIFFILITLSPLPELRRQQQSALTTLSQYKTEMTKLALIKERTNSIEKIIAERRLYDVPLNVVQSKLPDGVEISALNVENRTLSLTISSDSLDRLNTFISNLTSEVNEKKNFSQLTMSRLSMEKERNRYLVTLTLVLL